MRQPPAPAARQQFAEQMTLDASHPPPIAPVLRFAPSPNGRLHLGHAYSALSSAAFAQRLGGRFLVRIEDIDIGRCRPEFIASIFEDLAWLGIAWEQPVLRQSEHLANYAAAARRLEAMGLLYPCFATRSEILAAATGAVDPDGAPLYPGLHRALSDADIARRRAAGEPFAMRIDIARAVAVAEARCGPLTFRALGDGLGTTEIAADPCVWGDAVIQRKDVPTSYHLSVVVDDARQGVTHVTRGLDLYPATSLHRLLQVLLGLPAPIYWHHPLIHDREGRKLSKSERDTSLAELRSQGVTVAEIRHRLEI